MASTSSHAFALVQRPMILRSHRIRVTPRPYLLLRKKWHINTGQCYTFATNTKQGNKTHYKPSLFVTLVTVAATGASLYTRHLREQKLSSLTEAKDSELLCTDKTEGSTISHSSSSTKHNIPSLIETITRAGLIGSTKSVKDELHVLRKWHLDRGYNGGVVVRDLSRPLFSLNVLDFGHGNSSGERESHSEVNPDDIANIDHTNRRECYYLYYEIHSNGETRQQLFCRGTTLFADVLTCLQTWFAYDEELGCRVHYGFNKHADRIVDDVIPLLVPPQPKSELGSNATVEVCGHSLGGAVAMLVAIKLKKRAPQFD